MYKYLSTRSKLYEVRHAGIQDLKFVSLNKIRSLSMENSNNSRGRDGDGDRGCVGFPAHSQVIKIRQEFEKIKHTSPQQLEKRGVIRCRIYRQRSRSPLGLVERPIPVGN